MTEKPRVLLTGASSGIGAATLQLLTRQGYRVVGACRNPELVKADWEKQNQTSRLHIEAADLRVPSEVDGLFERAQTILGGIDILINNAGMGELGSVEETSAEFTRAMFEVNYFSALRLTQLALPGMRARRSGIILNLGSIVHSLQFPFKAQYCASKSALSSFTLSLRHEVSPYGIRVHLLEPGWVRSAFHERMQPVIREGSPYASRLTPFLDFSRDRDPRIPDGEAVARILAATLANPKAPVRIAVGSEAKRFFRVSRLLSHQMIDRILQWKLVRKGGVL